MQYSCKRGKGHSLLLSDGLQFAAPISGDGYDLTLGYKHVLNALTRDVSGSSEEMLVNNLSKTTVKSFK